MDYIQRYEGSRPHPSALSGQYGTVRLFGANLFSEDSQDCKICRKLGSEIKAAAELQTAKVDFEQYLPDQEHASIGIWRMAATD
ncbi:hypothetical protein D9M72_375700 [compost metagenome]